MTFSDWALTIATFFDNNQKEIRQEQHNSFVSYKSPNYETANTSSAAFIGAVVLQ